MFLKSYNKAVLSFLLPSKSSHTPKYAAVFRESQALEFLLLYTFLEIGIRKEVAEMLGNFFFMFVCYFAGAV